MADIWYKEAVIYNLDVRSFYDSNADGIGDFKGLIEKLEYLKELGINCLWLLPFYPSDHKDAGYDIIDYYSVGSETGTMADFVEFIEKAKTFGIKILMDLVVNHTSLEHKWFKEAIKDRNSKYHKYYIWLDEKPENHDQDVIFKNVEDSNWHYHKEADAYYYHTFYRHQPDLNVANIQVQEEILKIIDFWMKLGITGFRIDAVPHILIDKGNEKFKGDPYQIIDGWQLAVNEHCQDGILIAEADVEPKDFRNFLGDGNRIHGLLNFYLNNYIFLALADKDPEPIMRAFEQLPPLMDNEQYLNFIRNHDELDLERLKPEERERVYKVFAPDNNMRIYNRGIRRRLAPMLNNDRRIMEMTLSLLFTLPGTPVLRYGDEIGMGDDLGLKERDSVRTSMQWSNSKNGGFSSASSDKLFWPVISNGEYGYQSVNVADQMQDHSSLFNSIKSMLDNLQQLKEFGWGNFEQVHTDHPKILAHLCRHHDKAVMAVHNFSEEQLMVNLKVTGFPIDQFKQLQNAYRYKIKGNDEIEIEMPPYGYTWWRLV